MDIDTENAVRDKLDELVENMVQNLHLEYDFRKQLKEASTGLSAEQRFLMADCLARYLHDAVTMHPALPNTKRPTYTRALRYISQRLDIVDWERRQEAMDQELSEMLDEWMDTYVEEDDETL